MHLRDSMLAREVVSAAGVVPQAPPAGTPRRVLAANNAQI
jgi:hypothetical protein